ncbi:hypothetical protein MBLNU459_g1879t1 [Dothideomycetes sp. NU459]
MISSNDTAPTPFLFSPSQYWDGNDGSWSSFIVRVGTPPQDFRIFPSTVGQETLIPVPEGCTSNDPSNCGGLRGVLPFQGTQGTGFLVNASSSWVSINIDTVNIEAQLGYDVNAIYGFDTVRLEVENSGGFSQLHQVVGGIAAKSFYLGVFGLGPKPSNFSTFNDPQPSYMANLVTSKQIPSMSYGYTAGASYRYDKVLGSLTLGGYDGSRFTPSSVSFPFSPGDSNVLQVGIQSILGMSTLSGTINLLGTPMFSTIDSTLPYIWLPESTCDVFASAFGLVYDNSTDLYLVNDTIHSRLQDLNPTLTFVFGPSLYGGTTQNIVLPYAAFDLQASYPLYENATRYFPIRRAANSTQYIIGRTLLQEAYIVVDYDRSNFTVAQAVFDNPMPSEKIIAILPPTSNSTNGTSPRPRHHTTELGNRGIAAIVVCAVIALIILLGLSISRLRRRRDKAEVVPSTNIDAKDTLHAPSSPWTHDKAEFSGENINEMPVSDPPEVSGETSKWKPGGVQELQALGSEAELDSGHRAWAEAEGSPGFVHELEADAVPGRSQHRNQIRNLERQSLL